MALWIASTLGKFKHFCVLRRWNLSGWDCIQKLWNVFFMSTLFFPKEVSHEQFRSPSSGKGQLWRALPSLTHSLMLSLSGQKCVCACVYALVCVCVYVCVCVCPWHRDLPIFIHKVICMCFFGVFWAYTNWNNLPTLYLLKNVDLHKKNEHDAVVKKPDYSEGDVYTFSSAAKVVSVVWSSFACSYASFVTTILFDGHRRVLKTKIKTAMVSYDEGNWTLTIVCNSSH